MNIAIACRGLVRSIGNNSPDSYNPARTNWCMENLNIIKKALVGHNVSTFFSSWTVPGSFDLVNRYGFDHFALMKQPTIDEAFDILPVEPILLQDPNHVCHRKLGVFGFFCQSKAVMNLIDSSSRKFDYVIATRPDLRLSTSNINEWMNDKYVVPGIGYCRFNDHFGVASKDNMIKIFTQPLSVLEKTVSESRDCEDTLKNLVKYSGIKHEKNFDITEYNVRGFDVLDNHRRGGYDQYKDE